MNYNLIRDTYKALAATKQNSLTDFVIYAIARARFAAESEGEANYLMTKAVLKAVTPAKRHNKLAFNYSNDAFFKLHNVLHKLAGNKFPIKWKNNLEDADFKQIGDDAYKLMDAMHRHYLYIFVRQDMCAEQVTVQATHATFCAGHHISRDVEGNSKRPRKFDPSNTHFVLIGVPDLSELLYARGIAEVAGISTHAFHEEDMNNEMTAFTTGIVTQENRHYFKSFGLLKHNKEN